MRPILLCVTLGPLINEGTTDKQKYKCPKTLKTLIAKQLKDAIRNAMNNGENQSGNNVH